MKKLILIVLIQVMWIVCIIGTGLAANAPEWTVSFSGVIQRPLNLTDKDLEKFKQVTVSCELQENNGCSEKGAKLRGIPLKSLMEFVHIQKEGTPFSKPYDLGLCLRSRNGDKIMLSWGEVFERSPSDIILALSKSQAKTEIAGIGTKEMGFPRLITVKDQNPLRCLKGVTNIEVVEIAPQPSEIKQTTAPSPSFTVAQNGTELLMMMDLAAYPPGEVVRPGPSGQGIVKYLGVFLVDILKKLGVDGDLNTMIILVSQSGRQSAVSYGELTLSDHGRRILVAEQINGERIKDTGRFHVVFPEDFSQGRRVESLKHIKVLQIKQAPQIFVIGMGCGDTRFLTLEALSYIYRTDAFVCNDYIGKSFRHYMGNKPILFNPLMQVSRYYLKRYPDTPPKEAKTIVTKIYKDNIKKIKAQLDSGKTIALLEPGDPTVYGGWTKWLPQHFDKDLIKVVAGISSFNVANALFGKNVTQGSVLITEPRDLLGDENMIRSIAAGRDTMVIFMGLKDLRELTPLFLKHYRPDTPAHLVYNAGQNHQEKTIYTTIEKAVDTAEQESERFLGLIYIGWDLKQD